jgi:hypothetical protein
MDDNDGLFASGATIRHFWCCSPIGQFLKIATEVHCDVASSLDPQVARGIKLLSMPLGIGATDYCRSKPVHVCLDFNIEN